jgi:hypothetical protein
VLQRTSRGLARLYSSPPILTDIWQAFLKCPDFAFTNFIMLVHISTFRSGESFKFKWSISMQGTSRGDFSIRSRGGKVFLFLCRVRLFRNDLAAV